MRQLTKPTLLELSKAALENAEALLGEAEALLAVEHFARAYFLAVASIEEIGKSALAFNAAGRDLNNPRVAKAAREKLLDHKSKIISAFGPSLHLTQKDGLEEAIEASMELISALRRGREPSMYTEILQDGTVRSPRDIVRPVAARDSARLAKHCLHRAKSHLAGGEPPATSVADDFFYTQSASKIKQLMEHPDFSPFYLERIKGGLISLEEAIYAFSTRSAA